MLFAPKEKGQGLVEYLIIVAIVAVGSIAIMKTFGHTVKGQLSRVVMSLQGKENPSSVELNPVANSQWKKRDMSDFFSGANGHGGD